MKLEFHKSATVTLSTDTARVMCDPWLVSGEYYGAWHHCPEFPITASTFADLDAVFITHIHPDHCSRKTLDLIPRSIPVFILDFHAKFLRRGIESMGFTVREIPHLVRTKIAGDLYITPAAADNCNPELCGKFLGCPVGSPLLQDANIDTLCLFDDGEHFVLNVNDCPYSLAVDAVNRLIRDTRRIDLLLVGYGGAGPFPQCFELLSDAEKAAAAAKKQLSFLRQAEDYVAAVMPKAFMPFAGTYTLGGRLFHLNTVRGLPSLAEAGRFLSTSAVIDHKECFCVVPSTHTVFDLALGPVSHAAAVAELEGEQKSVNHFTLRNAAFDFDNDTETTVDELKRLLVAAHARFELRRKRLQYTTETNIFIPIGSDVSGRINLRDGTLTFVSLVENFPGPFVSYRVEAKLLARLLSGPAHAHWNNAEIGSHIMFGRSGASYERGLHHCVNFLHA